MLFNKTSVKMRHTELKEISQDTQRIHEEFKQKHKKILAEDV